MSIAKIATVTAALAFALTACGSGGEPTKETTVTETATPDAADTTPATDDTQAEKEAETGNDLWAQLDTYDDAYSLGQAIGKDYWDSSGGGHSLDCTKVNQETSQERDEHTGEVVDVTTMVCARAGTAEQVELTVADEYDEEGVIAVPVCDPAFEGDTCFTGKGWMIDADSTGMLKEMLENVGVDPDDWGIGEAVGYDEDGE